MEAPLYKPEHIFRARMNQRIAHCRILFLCACGVSLVLTISLIYSNQIYQSLHVVFPLNKSQEIIAVPKPLDLCPISPKNLVGRFDPDRNETSLDVVDELFPNIFESGGYYKPSDCIARDRVAILVPVRNRDEQIPILLKTLHPMLMRQQIEYQIFIVHQTPGFWFNRGALFNVGFVEALKLRNWDCFIFHDVDTIPIDDRNLYICPRTNPRHMGGAIDKFNFTLYYETFFGTVYAMTVDQYKKINGHANSFWGWGGEDNDCLYRINDAGYIIERFPLKFTRYVSLKHKHGSTYNPRWAKQVDEGKVPGRSKIDGLNSLKYHIESIERRKTHTSIHVEFNPQEMGRDPREITENQ